jgi:glycosyltransferase involved in cell wall biosynthesis
LIAKPARILIATHAPLSAEYGAAQLAITLAENLRRNGHEVLLWSPELPADTRWWRARSAMRCKLARFIEENGPFHLVDAPPLLLPREACSRVCVARSVQPTVSYLLIEVLSTRLRKPRDAARWLLLALLNLLQLPVLLGDWLRARHIVALGELEYQWMKKWTPFLASKLSVYRPPLQPAQRVRLAGIRGGRPLWAGPGVRFLWIGRWVPHKGIDRVVDFLRTRFAIAPADRVTLAGCGELPRGSIADDLLRSGHVRIVPSFSRNELAGLLESHDAGLFTSRVEGWGLSLNEMIEAGLPVFATMAGAVADLQRACPGCVQPFPPPPVPDINDLRARMKLGEAYDALINWDSVVALYERLIQDDKNISARPGSSLRF